MTALRLAPALMDAHIAPRSPWEHAALGHSPPTTSTFHPMPFPGNGQMAEQISSFDWAKTSLGPIDAWPRALQNIVSTVLAWRQPICFWWGPDLLQIHNDDYLPLLADRADNALGQPFQKLWSDVWNGVRPFVEEAMAGRGTWAENLTTYYGSEWRAPGNVLDVFLQPAP